VTLNLFAFDITFCWLCHKMRINRLEPRPWAWAPSVHFGSGTMVPLDSF